ncbi:hypothetical protein TNCT_710481 [Trichonephila clavata]|uniref:Uncharacterized protein n=1 Tax=Trichonephila clavata TaxID=2740835 RepID=A0A8X6KT65_TRICU|nr:hypothetical protein TNCT_710481 [Trichonephila clavata]
MVWDAFGYHGKSHYFKQGGTLNSGTYIREVGDPRSPTCLTCITGSRFRNTTYLYVSHHKPLQCTTDFESSQGCLEVLDPDTNRSSTYDP